MLLARWGLSGRHLGQWLVDLANLDPRAWIQLVAFVAFFTALFYFKRWWLNR